MDLGLNGKIALVCGANRGLGLAAARSLSREGAVVVLAARGRETLERAAAEITQAFGGETLVVPTDLSKPEEARRLARSAMEAYGRVDVLVNNAGGPPSGTFLDFADSDWEAAFRLNLMSAVILAREVLPGMMERGFGRIVNLTSIAVKQPIDGLILSNAVRSAVHGWAKTLSNEAADRGVTVNNVMTGYTLTDRVKNLARTAAEKEGKSVDEVIRGMAAGIPMKRIGVPEDVGDLVAYLASERAGYITGASIPIDGGYSKGQ